MPKPTLDRLPTPPATRTSAFQLRAIAEQLARDAWEMDAATFDLALKDVLHTIDDKGALLCAAKRLAEERIAEMEAEAAPFLAAAAQAKAQLERVKVSAQALLEGVEAVGEEPKLKGVGWALWMQTNGGLPTVEVLDPLAVPTAYYTQPPTPAAYVDPEKVRRAYEDDIEVPGTRVSRGRHVVVK